LASAVAAAEAAAAETLVVTDGGRVEASKAPAASVGRAAAVEATTAATRTAGGAIWSRVRRVVVK